MRKRLPPLFWIGLTLGVIGLLDGILFLIWRWNKPPNNPGGPLASMGAWVMVWEVSSHVLMFLGSMCAMIASVMIQMQENRRENRKV